MFKQPYRVLFTKPHLTHYNPGGFLVEVADNDLGFPLLEIPQVL